MESLHEPRKGSAKRLAEPNNAVHRFAGSPRRTRPTFRFTGSEAGFVILLAAILTGCSREEIRVYRAPKEKPSVDVATASSHDHTPRAFPKLEWQLPAGWEERGPGRMSLASFWIAGSKEGEGAEVSVMPMPGESASNLSLLVNIVRQSAGMKPMSDEEIAKLAENVQIGEATARMLDLSGATASTEESQTNQMVLVVFPRAGTTWFFKMAGSASLVSTQKAAFLGFLKSIKFQEVASSTEIASAAPNAVDRVSSGAGPVKPQWEAPGNWQEVPPTQMLLAKFLLTGAANAKAEVTVSVFSGPAGGVAANVNRWRKQLSLSELSEADASKETSPLDLVEGKAMLVDMSGQDARSGSKARLIGVIFPQGGQTWFYKLMGDETVAEQEKAAFLKFVQTAKHPNGA